MPAPANQNLENESNLENHRIQDYKLPSLTPRYPNHRGNQNASIPRITKHQSENYVRNSFSAKYHFWCPQPTKTICQETHTTYNITEKLDQPKM